jgi:hypothetical protein
MTEYFIPVQTQIQRISLGMSKSKTKQMRKACQVRVHLPLEALSIRKQAKSIGTVHASAEWLMAPVVQNFERHSLVSSIQKQNQRESTASRNFKICRTASERILNSMLTVRKFCSVFWSYVDLIFFYRNYE